MTVKIFQDSLERALSPERLAPYLTKASGDIDLALAIYRWNLDLVSLIMPLISDVEVTLRNTIHTQLTDHFATAQWRTSPRLLLDDDTREMITSAVRKHRRKLKNGSEGPGRFVADVTFGVWVNLLSRGSFTAMQQPVNYEANLWRKAIMHGFQVGDETNARGLPKRPIRRQVHHAAAKIQALRNAAGHHRKISEGIRQPGSAPDVPRIPLIDLVEAGTELLSWMSPDLADLHRRSTTISDRLAGVSWLGRTARDNGTLWTRLHG